MDLKQYIANIPDYPKDGIIFRDITPILQNPEAMKEVTDQLAEFAKECGADVIVAPEARGFFFGIPAALEAGISFVPVRKPGKLPRKTITAAYALEYGVDSLEMHEDALKPGAKVVIIDDLLATGGTVEAIEKMVKKLKGEVVGYGFVVELDDLDGKSKLKSGPVKSLTHYEGD